MNRIIAFIINQEDVIKYNSYYFDQHPTARKPPIKGPQHPSINEYLSYNRHAANNLKQHWKNFIVFLLKDRGLDGLGIEKCKVTYRVYFKNRRRHDLDNVTPKYIFDGFVEAGFIVDDSLEHITSLTIEGEICATNPHMEFIIEILE